MVGREPSSCCQTRTSSAAAAACCATASSRLLRGVGTAHSGANQRSSPPRASGNHPHGSQARHTEPRAARRGGSAAPLSATTGPEPPDFVKPPGDKGVSSAPAPGSPALQMSTTPSLKGVQRCGRQTPARRQPASTKGRCRTGAAATTNTDPTSSWPSPPSRQHTSASKDSEPHHVGHGLSEGTSKEQLRLCGALPRPRPQPCRMLRIRW